MSSTANQTAVSSLYVALLGRNPDQSGYAYWVGKLNAGETQMAAATEMAYSTEFSPYNSLDTTTGITRIYNNVFNRAPDTGGLNYWSAQFTATLATVPASNVNRVAIAFAQIATQMVDTAYTTPSSDQANIQAKVNESLPLL